jgi:hypothetical protein
MNHSRCIVTVGIAFSLVAAVGAGCSSNTPVDEGGGGSTGSGSGGRSNSGSGGSGSTPTGNGSCASSQLKLLFTPMFSAYDGVHMFQVPVVVNNIDSSAIKFSADDPSMVDIGPPDPDTGIAMITVHKAGTVNIVANAGGLCGTSLLTITASTPDDWEAGNQRYNSGIVLPPRGMGGRGRTDAGPTDGPVSTEYACTNCHGDTATMLRYRTVAHTPEQTGGFTDDEMQNVFRHGMVPAGKASYFDFGAVSITQEQWSGFHRWDMTDDQAKGIITYLRALTPTPQTGKAGAFGGGFMRPDGGRRRGDGGGNNAVDAGAPVTPGAEMDAAAP